MENSLLLFQIQNRWGGGGSDSLILISYGEKYFYLKLLLSLFGNKNILNGGCAGTSLVYLIFAYLKPSTLIYTQATKWGYSGSEKASSKLKIFLSYKIHTNNLILCMAKQQETFLKNKFGVHIKTSIIYYSINSTSLKLKQNNNELNIIMIGTIQKRKGIELYSELADLAKQKGDKWNFYWLGHANPNTSHLYRSKNITFLDYNNDVNGIIRQTDIFFLSSIDEPCSLAVLEALNQYKKMVAYRHTGSAELIENISGCGIYERYDAKDAYKTIKKVIQEPLDIDKVKYINQLSSNESFAKRLDGVLEERWGR